MRYGEEFLNHSREVAFYEMLCGEAWVQSEASSESTKFQLVTFGLFHHLKSILDTRQPSTRYCPFPFTLDRIFLNIVFTFQLTIQKLPLGKMGSLRFRFQLY